ncbi:MAG: glycosyltransferase [Bdellovibrionaceae bacterium]|nr:glycosyltransferase [Bdellovibrionales bacterium]MCB9253133.1 glycosyltransferase [Pseudobdellovibrionaceae bacterium]
MPSITWHIQVYKDEEYLPECLSALRRSYPDSRIFLISDGDPNPKIEQIANQFGSECFYGERLFGIEHGGEILHRLLDYYLNRPSDYLIKIDGDTLVNRRILYLPITKRPLLMGTRQVAGDGEEDLVSVQGGCIILNHAAASLMHESKLFLDPRLKPPDIAWARKGTHQEERAMLGLTSHDWTIGWVCKELNIEIWDHPEIASYWKEKAFYSLSDVARNYRMLIRRFWPAVTHPNKIAAPVDSSQEGAERQQKSG